MNGGAPRAPQAAFIKRLESADVATAERWDAFVLNCPDATFFHCAGWQRIMEQVFRHRTHFLYAERDGQIEGVLALAHVKSVLFGNALVSLPFTVYGGVAAANAESATALETEAHSIARRLRVGHLELRNTVARHSDWQTQQLYVTFRKEISSDPEANMLAIPRKQRAMVRKGIKNGLVSEIDSGVDRFFELFAANVHRHGTPALPKCYFEALLREFGRNCEVLTVTDGSGRALSSVLSFYFRDEVLPYYAGDDESARAMAGNDFKYWELMRRACERGVKVFDYGRSKQGTGSYAFKKNWGFEPAPLAYEYVLLRGKRVPEHNPLNPKYRLFIKLWQRLPRPVASFVGPYIVKSLG
jgi:FemAB-related protein (PEP-CTERM system-associated)